MNPHASAPCSAAAMFGSIADNWFLIKQMAMREIVGRYRGSLMGLLWSFLNPIIMLAIYTFIFSVVFKTRWDIDTGNKFDFALILFAGLLIYSLFSESLARAPGLVLNNSNYVKKITFPLEILVCVMLFSAIFHALISTAVLLIFYFVIHWTVNWTILLFPVVWIPFILMTMGLSWFLASLGVYIRDIGQVIGFILTAIMFLSPVFYPIKALPPNVQHIMFLNPIALIVEEFRAVALYGRMPNFAALGLYLVVALLVAWLGFAWFQKTRKGFADVI